MEKKPFSVILLAGGTGSRMGASIPKQYVLLKEKPIALYSFEVFASMPEVQEIVVVCEPLYQHLFQSYFRSPRSLSFALPGDRRQDSVFNGLQALSSRGLVCVHDSARPFIDTTVIRRTVCEASKHGAAVLGVPVKATIKICHQDKIVKETPERSTLWEVQTPQIIQFDLLKEGFKRALNEKLTVTDDVSLVELMNHPVKVVEGSYLNIKITTPDDLVLAERLLEKHVHI